MNCNLTDAKAVWTLDNDLTDIDVNGDATDSVNAIATGFYCTNCGNGFADKAGFLSHIVNYIVPTNEVDQALTDAQAVTIDAIPDFQAQIDQSNLVEEPAN